MAAFLDTNGLQTLWAKIKALVEAKVPTKVTVTDSTSSKTYAQIATLLASGDVECVFSKVTVDTLTVTGRAPVMTITDSGVIKYQALMPVMKTATDQYLVTAVWTSDTTTATITVARLESGLAIDEDAETSEQN